MKSKSPKTQHVWTKGQLSLLGKISDGALARQLGLTTTQVFIKRNTMGIPAMRAFKTPTWGPKEISLLGKYPDTEVARQLSISYKVVMKKRLDLGIQCFARSAKLWHQWKQKEIDLLGTDIDRVIAKRIGINPITVSTKRKQLGIPSFRKRKATNRPRRSIDSWTPAEIALLGKFTDNECADKLDLSPGAVRIKRIALGIPPCRRGRQRREGIWTPGTIKRLGKEPSSDIARDLGVTRQRVCQKIQELGIPAYGSPKR